MASSLSFGVLRLPDFRLLLAARTLNLMALVAQDVIVGWQVYSLTKDPFMLGLTGLTEAVPAIACAFFSGHIVDISRPYRVYFLCMMALTFNALVLLLLAGGIIPVAASTMLACLFTGIFISGLARSFIMPSSYSLLPQTVPRADIPTASAWLGSGYQISAIAGPALAGIIYGGYGPKGAWLLPVCILSLGLMMLSGVSTERRQYRSGEKREPTVKSIKAGWRFIFQNKVLLSVMALDMFAVLFGGAVAMLPAYADHVLHVGSQGLGALRAAPALGAVITAVWLAVRPLKRIPVVLLMAVITGFGLCMIGFGLSTVFWVSMVFLAISGACDSVSVIIRSTLLQLLTPDAMRGRVSAVNSMFIISSNEIGSFESGLTAKLFGLVPSVVIGGIGTLVVVALTAILSPQMRRMTVDAENAS